MTKIIWADDQAQARLAEAAQRAVNLTNQVNSKKKKKKRNN